MIKIIFFVTNLDSGGLENYLLRFLESYGSRFGNVIVFCKGAKYGVLEPRYETIENVKIVKRKIGNYHPHHYVWLKSWFEDRRDYVVCDFTGNFAGPILWAAKAAGISKRVAFYRSSSNRFKETVLRLRINRWYNVMVSKYATNIYANSKYAFKFFFRKEELDKRFKVIYNGLDIRKFLAEQSNLREEFGIGEDVFVIGHTGRFNPAKNHKIILEVAFRILSDRKDVVFIMCGKGVKEHLQGFVEERGASQHILLFENRSDIDKFLNTCNMYLFPSITEGQPNALIEAWIKGLPFVASDIPPIKQLVPEEFYSYLTRPDDVDSIVDLLRGIIDNGFDNAHKESLKRWANTTFDAKERFEEFYHELIKDEI